MSHVELWPLKSFTFQIRNQFIKHIPKHLAYLKSFFYQRLIDSLDILRSTDPPSIEDSILGFRAGGPFWEPVRLKSAPWTPYGAFQVPY